MTTVLTAFTNTATLTVAKRPRLALLATGDELVLPGQQLGPDRIVASNSFGLAALFAWCDPQGTLAAAQSQCIELAGRCRALNERNAALVTARLTRVTGMLDMLGDTPAARTYDPRLARVGTVPAGRMVSVSA